MEIKGIIKGFFGAVILAYLPQLLANSPEEALKIFRMFAEKQSTFDSTIVEMYSDEATITAKVMLEDGNHQVIEYDGKSWKRRLNQILPAAKAINDINIFSGIEVHKVKSGYKIKAKRYSVKRCYLDENYHMTLAQNSNGYIKVFEEYVEISNLSKCQEASSQPAHKHAK